MDIQAAKKDVPTIGTTKKVLLKKGYLEFRNHSLKLLPHQGLREVFKTWGAISSGASFAVVI